MATPSIPAGIDFTDPDLLAERVPLAELDEMRRTAPVAWHPQPRGIGGFDDEGFWMVTRLADIKDISRRPQLFSSEENTAISRFYPGMERDAIEMQRNMLLNMDPPKHTKVRRIIAKGFTPKATNALRDALAARARRIVADAREKGTGDFVLDVACELPLQAIADLIGIPQHDRKKVFDWSNQMVGYDDDEYETDQVTASAEIMGYAYGMSEERQACPMDDIATKIVNADLDGESLSSEEFAWFVLILAVAGNETTRNAISHGMKAFLDHPEQWEAYKRERPRTAPDEIVRWATPVASFQRTATEDTELGGQQIRKGDRVVMFYSAANRDPEAFDRPNEFDIFRDPNPHVGFGGTGTHYCVGANLARLEIDLIFNTIADVMPDISEAGDQVRFRSGWLNGVKHYPVRYA